MILQVKLKGLEVFCQIVLEFFKSAINRLIPTVNQTLSVEEIGEFSLKQLNFRWKWVDLTGSSQEYRLIGPGSRTGQVVMLRVVVSCVIVIANPRHQRIGTSVSSSARKCEAFCKASWWKVYTSSIFLQAEKRASCSSYHEGLASILSIVSQNIVCKFYFLTSNPPNRRALNA